MRPLPIARGLAAFDRMPDSAIIDDKIAAQLLNISVRTLRRTNLIRQYRITERRLGRRAGDLRKLIEESAA